MPTPTQSIRGYVHRIRVGGDDALFKTIDHLRTKSISDLSIIWDSLGKAWYVDFYWPHKNVEWALEGLRPDILPPLKEKADV